MATWILLRYVSGATLALDFPTVAYNTSGISILFTDI